MSKRAKNDKFQELKRKCKNTLRGEMFDDTMKLLTFFFGKFDSNFKH